jgi:hypothetical protein
MTVLSDRDGRASTEGLTINTVEGLMPIQVTASFEGETASAEILQSNIRGPAGMSTGAKAAIFGAIAAGAIVGVVKAVGGEETLVAPPIRGTASVGTPTVSPP